MRIIVITVRCSADCSKVPPGNSHNPLNSPYPRLHASTKLLCINTAATTSTVFL